MSDGARSIGLAAGAGRVFELAWPSLAWGRRGRWLLALLAWPALLPLLARAAGAGGAAWKDVAGGFYLETLLPLVALFQASRLIRDEVEGRTIVFLLARPVPRASILGGQLAAYLAAALAMTWPCLVAAFFLSVHETVDRDAAALWRALAGSAAALAAYGALFALAGLLLKKPTVAGLLFLFGWEGLIHAPGHLPRLTLTAHLRALTSAPGAPPELSATLAGVILIAFTLVCLLAAIAVFRNGEYVPEP